MNSIQRTEGGFEKVVWENIVDTLPGGLNIDVSTIADIAAAFPDGIIPEGTPVAKNLTTGLGEVVTVVSGTPDSLSKVPLGYTNQTVKIAAGINVPVGVGISGTIRLKALPANVVADKELFIEALPRITHV